MLEALSVLMMKVLQFKVNQLIRNKNKSELYSSIVESKKTYPSVHHLKKQINIGIRISLVCSKPPLLFNLKLISITSLNLYRMLLLLLKVVRLMRGAILK